MLVHYAKCVCVHSMASLTESKCAAVESLILLELYTYLAGIFHAYFDRN